ncbi:MAG: DUF4366 domain-containing protein, partial [Acetatifactor muris]|nr:DUF4366 domain-containing protein [Acetatifactor muris]
YFTISAMDNAGNMSETYQTKNPYYKDPADESDENPAAQLPESAEATNPGSATGTVTEHMKTDSSGNDVTQEAAEDGDAQTEGESGQGKEFYTITTATDKVFYLVIDRDGEEEVVYFLTEITENDLLNATSDNNETLPKNSAALESAVTAEESALPNNNGIPAEYTEETESGEEMESVEETEYTEKTESMEEATEQNPVASYILMGAVAVLFVGGAYYFKVMRRKKERFLEDEDDDMEDTEEYADEDTEDENGSDDFFDRDDEA